MLRASWRCLVRTETLVGGHLWLGLGPALHPTTQACSQPHPQLGSTGPTWEGPVDTALLGTWHPEATVWSPGRGYRQSVSPRRVSGEGYKKERMSHLVREPCFAGGHTGTVMWVAVQYPGREQGRAGPLAGGGLGGQAVAQTVQEALTLQSCAYSRCWRTSPA